MTRSVAFTGFGDAARALAGDGAIPGRADDHKTGKSAGMRRAAEMGDMVETLDAPGAEARYSPKPETNGTAAKKAVTA